MYENVVTQLAKEKAGKTALTKAIWERADEYFKDKYSVGAKAPLERVGPAIVEANKKSECPEADYMSKRASS